MGGESESDGRLEICLNKRWTTINGIGWTNTDTKVACNQLNNYSASGYNNNVLDLVGKFKSTESHVSYDEVQRGDLEAIQTTNYGCDGNEVKLIECRRDKYTNRWISDKVIGISCSSSLTADKSNSNGDTEQKNLIIAAFCFLALIIIAFFVIYVINSIRRKRNARLVVTPHTQGLGTIFMPQLQMFLGANFHAFYREVPSKQ